MKPFERPGLACRLQSTGLLALSYLFVLRWQHTRHVRVLGAVAWPQWASRHDVECECARALDCSYSWALLLAHVHQCPSAEGRQ